MDLSKILDLIAPWAANLVSYLSWLGTQARSFLDRVHGNEETTDELESDIESREDARLRARLAAEATAASTTTAPTKEQK